MKRHFIAAILIAVASPLSALADDAHHKDKGAPSASPSASQLADGEVRKVDKDAKKLTIRHGPLPSLDMPAMTMVFQVKDPALLDQVKTGDKIRFSADKVGGQYVVTRIEPVK
jgi:Cu(I)/Ag(I) efflux system protein CusF